MVAKVTEIKIMDIIREETKIKTMIRSLDTIIGVVIIRKIILQKIHIDAEIGRIKIASDN